MFIKVQELQIVLRATQTLDALIFFKKKVLSYLQSEIHLFWRNIVSKSYIQACYFSQYSSRWVLVHPAQVKPIS